MGKKLSDIKTLIDSSSTSFWEYLNKNTENEAIDLILELNQYTSVYIFSGVIRNYFINVNEIRDIDIVIKDKIELNQILSIYTTKKNSFGGYKIQVKNTNIDLWCLEDTWAIKNEPVLEYFLDDKYIISTAFFNFSSILFSLNEDKFIYTEEFVKFLRDKEIDVLYKLNANYSLCIVNSIYYAEKFKLKLSDKLKQYIKTKHKSCIQDYENTQMKHFGSVLYTNNEIETKLMFL